MSLRSHLLKKIKEHRDLGNIDKVCKLEDALWYIEGLDHALQNKLPAKDECCRNMPRDT